MSTGTAMQNLKVCKCYANLGGTQLFEKCLIHSPAVCQVMCIQDIEVELYGAQSYDKVKA